MFNCFSFVLSSCEIRLIEFLMYIFYSLFKSMYSVVFCQNFFMSFEGNCFAFSSVFAIVYLISLVVLLYQKLVVSIQALPLLIALD